MAVEKTGNQSFDMMAARLDQRIQAGKATSDVMVSDVMTALALRDDQTVSPKEQAVITHLKGKIPAVATAPAPSKPANQGYTSAKVSNFYTYFLNFKQLKEGQAFGEETIVKGKVPHLDKQKSLAFAQTLGFQNAYELQRHVGAHPDGLVGPKTIAKLNAQNETKANQVFKAPDLKTLEAMAKADRRGFTESTYQSLINYRERQLKPAT